jgi:hypothetical protein
MKLIEGKHLGPWKLLPAKPGKCPECATAHDPSQAHNAQSLAYQYFFYNQHGRWPNWKDAIKHCSPEMKKFWKEQLTAMGVNWKAGEITTASRSAKGVNKDE